MNTFVHLLLPSFLNELPCSGHILTDGQEQKEKWEFCESLKVYRYAVTMTVTGQLKYHQPYQGTAMAMGVPSICRLWFLVIIQRQCAGPDEEVRRESARNQNAQHMAQPTT